MVRRVAPRCAGRLWVIYHVQRKRNQEKREKRKSTKNSNREQQTEERNIKRFIKNQGREIHSNKLKKSDVATMNKRGFLKWQ